jgi:hypothetical protein
MNVDYQDPSLDSLLTEHARRSRAEFTPPVLEGMLTSALDSGRSHRRWVWPVLAAVLLLAIPLVTVLLVRYGRTDSQPAHPNSKLVPVGPVPWADPVWTGRSIQFTAELTHAQACQGLPSIQAKVTADSASSVTIVATEYINPDPAAASKLQKITCADPAAADGKAYYGGAVELPEPWNGRAAVDGTSQSTFRVLDASFVPSIPGLPSAFHSQGYYGHAQQSLVGRSWADPRVQITLSLQPINLFMWSDGKPSTIGLVNGHPTEFLDLDRHTIAWQNGAYVYELQEIPLNGTNDFEFSPEQLLNLARSVH